jgi:hypothetical protein
MKKSPLTVKSKKTKLPVNTQTQKECVFFMLLEATGSFSILGGSK